MTTREVSAPEGEVEYEVVTCSSCEQQYTKRDCAEFVVGDIQNTKQWNALGKMEYEFDTNCERGWLCEYCMDEQNFLNINFPSEHSISLDEMELFMSLMCVVAICVMLLII